MHGRSTPCSPTEEGLPAGACPWRAVDWKYLGEGNLHIVLSFRGNRPKWRGQVLRLRKITTKSVASLRECVVFARAVIGELLGAQYTAPARLVRLPQSFVQAVASYLASEVARPVHRRNVGLDISCLDAVLLPDLTLPKLPAWARAADDADSEPTGAALCVEIKPKCGVAHPAASYAGQRAPCCRFCQHQALKLLQGKVRWRSRYCPLRLFSAREGRALQVNDAIRGLFATPQNNLRVFEPKGALAYGEELPGEATACKGREQWTQRDREQQDPGQQQTRELRRRSAQLNTVCRAFSPSGSAALSGADTLVLLLTEVILSERLLFERLYHVQLKDRLGAKRLAQLVAQGSASDTADSMSAFAKCCSDQSLRALLSDFALATTAKDVSLMISVQPVTPRMALQLRIGSRLVLRDRNSPRLLINPASRLEYLDLATRLAELRAGKRGGMLGGSLLYSITVCDLDPKVRIALPVVVESLYISVLSCWQSCLT